MAANKRTHSRARKKAYRRVLKFPQARGKTIERVELSVSSDDCAIDIRFEDKTVISFDLDSSLTITPEFIDWRSGNYKPLKRWRPIST